MAPVRLLDVELAEALPPIRPDAEKGAYPRARVLVRLHGHPLGSVDLDLPSGEVDAAALADRIWEALGPKILTHLEEDQIPAVSSLTEAGLGSTGMPPCLRRSLGHAESVTVVVPTRDRPERLAACVESILNVDYPSSSLEVLVVDNAPAAVVPRIVRLLRIDLPHHLPGVTSKRWLIP